LRAAAGSEIARRLARWGLRSTTCSARQAEISGQMNGRLVQRERRRRVGSGREEIASTSRASRGIAVRFIGGDDLPGNPHQLVSGWKPGEPVWQGTIDGQYVAMQVRAIPNGIPTGGIQGYEAPINVFTKAEAAAARLCR